MDKILSKYEADAETGMHYAVARYYDSRLSTFNSTDPMWYKYPNVSRYVDCANHPSCICKNLILNYK